MQIKDVSTNRNIKQAEKRQNAPKGGGASLFAVELDQQDRQVDSYGEDVEQLRSSIEAAGEQLEKDPTLPNFKKFRELLSQLAKRISNEAYRLEKVGGTPQNPRYFEVITVINAEADKLYKLVVNEHRDRMAITAKVIGIKGLVVDLIT